MKNRLKLCAASLLLALPLAAPADAISLGAGVGVAKIENDGSPLYLNGGLRFTLIGPIKLEPEVGYWKQTEQRAGGEVSFEDFHVGGSALLVLTLHPAVELFGGGGVGWHFLDRSAGFGGVVRGLDDSKLAVHFLGGLEFIVSDRLGLFGVVRHDSFSDDDLVSLPSQTKYYGGLRLRF